MQRFLQKLGLFALINSIIILGFALVGYGRYTNYISTIDDKYKLVNQTTSRKILLVGGSNVAFGLSAAQIEKKTNIPTVNLALHAGLSMTFALEQAKAWAKPGDIVILSIEPSVFPGEEKSDRPSGDLLFNLAVTHPQYLGILPSNYKLLLDKGHQGLGGMFLAGIKDSATILRGKAIADSVYSRENFNSHGDMDGHCGLERKLAQTNFTGKPAYKDTWEVEHENRIEQIESFAKELGDRNVAVYYSFAPIPETNWKASKKVANLVKNNLNKIKNLQVIDTPEKAVYSDDSFYDTDNHLNCKQRQRRTAKVVNKLDKLEALGEFK